jgi:hypothetical protein
MKHQSTDFIAILGVLFCVTASMAFMPRSLEEKNG